MNFSNLFKMLSFVVAFGVSTVSATTAEVISSEVSTSKEVAQPAPKKSRFSKKAKVIGVIALLIAAGISIDLLIAKFGREDVNLAFTIRAAGHAKNAASVAWGFSKGKAKDLKDWVAAKFASVPSEAPQQ